MLKNTHITVKYSMITNLIQNGKTLTIQELDVYQQSLLFAELSMIAYNDEKQATAQAKEIGFTEVHFFDYKGAQGYTFETATDLVVACRGTEPTELSDLAADMNALPVRSQTMGLVHLGFKREADKIWAGIKAQIETSEKMTWFTGHSLGAAMTTLCAARCFYHAPHIVIGAIFTFGSPRAGWRGFVNNLNVPHWRWVNNADQVTTVPLAAMGYVHHGTIRYLNNFGNVREFTYWQRIKDKFRGIWKGLKTLSFKNFSDHSMTNYVAHIARKVSGNEYPQD
jgi:triacylglycerol lipase